MLDNENEKNLPEVYVQPGESRLVSEPVIIHTLLGSCVGVTFWAPRLGIAALCHCMLPTCPIKPRANPSFAAGNRYVDYAIRNLARQFSAMGVLHSEVQVKLFGGGDVLDFATETMRPTVGRLNREVALRVLDEEGFKVSASRLGGTRGVKIQFHTGTGEVLLRLLG